MDSEHVKGAADKAKGAIKDAAGKLLDDKKLQAEGKFDNAKGAAHNAAGDLKDAARRDKEHTRALDAAWQWADHAKPPPRGGFFFEPSSD